jgi:hypothetical protein
MLLLRGTGWRRNDYTVPGMALVLETDGALLFKPRGCTSTCSVLAKSGLDCSFKGVEIWGLYATVSQDVGADGSV